MLGAIRLCGILALTLALSGMGAALSAEPPSLDEACKTVLKGCRRNLTVQFRQADGTEYNKTFDVLYPPVQNQTRVTVFAGETVRLTAKVVDNRIVELMPASAAAEPSRIIEFSLKQMPDKPDMTLIIKNPFDRVLKYSAAMQVPPGNDPVATSVCPILAGKLGIEMWPYPVFQVFLSNFEFLPSLESAKCE
jgi:hypothetical protein